MEPTTAIDDPRYVKALSHPLRVRILAMLQERTATPVQLAAWLGARLGTVAYHVRTLHELELIELVDETRVRGAVAHHYRAKDRPVISDDAWDRAAPIAKQAAVGATLQTIDEYTRASAAAGGFDRGDAHLSRLVMRLDREGWHQVSAALAEVLERVTTIEDEAAERIKADPHADGISEAGVVMMLFDALRLTEQPAAPPRHVADRSVPA